MNYEKLFQPINIGPVSIKNRFVMPAMESGTTKDHYFTDQSKAYFLARAKGGFGLIITDYIAVSEDGIGVQDEAGLWDDCFIPSLQELTQLIHSTDTKIFAQLHHSGLMCQRKITGVQPKGPSAIAAVNNKEAIIAYTIDEIHMLVEQYAQAAKRAKAAGYDGIELHAAHGYQVAQFLSKYSNKRGDAYGGSYENRFRFAQEIIIRIHELCGKDFPLLFRISAEEFLEAGCTMQDAILYSQLAEAAGVDAIHVSTGTGIGGNIVTPHYVDPGFNANNAKRIKQSVHIPVICVGRINDPVLAASILANDQADMVALGRQSICDPQFPKKLLEHREHELFHCTGCMQRCYYSPGCEADDTGISCMLNPFSGKELHWNIQPAIHKKKIAIIGAGPAGLEAAWLLAKRGHQVTLYEKEQVAGGKFRLASIPPKKQDLAHAIYTYTELCNIYGVSLQLGKEIKTDDMKHLSADCIILATGSIPLLPNIPGLLAHGAITADELLDGKQLRCNENILILGGGLVGCETAEFLHQYQNSITIVDMADALAKEAVKRSRAVLLERLNKNHTACYLNTRIQQVLQDGIIADQQGKTLHLQGFTSIVIALGYQSYHPLEECARQCCSQVYVIGDAKKARDAKLAIYEGAKLGITL